MVAKRKIARHQNRSLWRISEQQLNEFIEKGSKRTLDKETSE